VSLTEGERVARLEPPRGRPRVVIDTDAANEVDDQFAIAHALLAPERLEVEALYAAPFQDAGRSGPAEGMRRSADEIGRVLEALGPLPGRDAPPPVLAGSTAWLPGPGTPVESAAAHDLLARAAAGPGLLHVVALAAPTTVASALLLDPALAERVVVVWLGGNPSSWPTAREFNLEQDVHASRVLLDSGVPLVHVPCLGVTEHLRISLAELERDARGHSRIGAYLTDLVGALHDDHVGRTKTIWDLGPGAWLIEPSWVPTQLVPSPVLTDGLTWSQDPARHLVREARAADRDAVFADLLRRVRAAPS
jgi:inosine-uridine nucleoside N-ribohydrolase